MNKTRVVCHLSIHPPFDQRVFYRTCCSLVEAGYETHLLAQLDEKEAVVDGVCIHSIAKIAPPQLGLNIKSRVTRFWRAMHIALGLRAELYHVHAIELIPLGLWLRLRTGAKIIFDSHEDNISYLQQKFYIPRPIRWILFCLISLTEWLAARFFDAIITADVGVANIYYQRYKASKVHPIHNFPRLEFFSKEIEAQIIEKEYDLVYHGTIPRYHLQIAFEVASLLRDRGVAAQWLFFGDCPEYKWACNELKQRELEGCFKIIPKRVPHDQVAMHILKARIGFIPLPDLPKFQRNIPTKLFEYMALGMPVVMSDLPPSRAFVGDEKCAFMIPPDAFDQYADAIMRLMEDEELCRRMGEEGRRRVQTLYNWQKESEKLLALYKELLE